MKDYGTGVKGEKKSKRSCGEPAECFLAAARALEVQQIYFRSTLKGLPSFLSKCFDLQLKLFSSVDWLHQCPPTASVGMVDLFLLSVPFCSFTLECTMTISHACVGPSLVVVMFYSLVFSACWTKYSSPETPELFAAAAAAAWVRHFCLKCDWAFSLAALQPFFK